MQIEVCCYSLADCRAAQSAGADRIELCGGRSDGGLTPSAGLIQLVKKRITLPIWVMIRPRGGDFLYDEDEQAVMLADLERAREAGANGFVLGCLNTDGSVDEQLTHRLIQAASPVPVAFHRAFDLSSDPFEALEAIIRTGALRILTSGQQPAAEMGAALLRSLTARAGGRVEIMAGAGVNSRNARTLAQTGVDALHLSGQQTYDSPMQFRAAAVRMASAPTGEYERVATSEDNIRQLIRALSSSG